MDKFLKPKEGLTILDPVLRDRVPPEGRLVTMSPYWTRRVLDGDMIEVPTPVSPPAPALTGAAAGDPPPPASLSSDPPKASGKKRAGETDN